TSTTFSARSRFIVPSWSRPQARTQNHTFGSRRRSVNTPYARCHDLQQMTVWVAEVQRLASIFPRLPQLNRDALFVQPAFPSSQIGTGDPKRDVNRAT